MKASVPQFQSFAEVVRWVIQELGGLCPSQERLLQWKAEPQREDLRDVRFHVQEARCQICLAVLEQEGSSPQSS